MAVCLRPFGALASGAEVMAGLWIIRGVVTDNESYETAITVTIFALGALVLGAGLLGLYFSARSWRQLRAFSRE